MSGRLTVNPMVHLDVFGSLMVLVAGFGYGGSGQSRNFRPRADAFCGAGPLMNLILGIVGGGRFIFFISPATGSFPLVG